MRPMELPYAAGTGVLIAGVDEAGRGPLAGPVVAAAVILPLDGVIEGIGDSKQLNAAERSRLAVEIKARSAAWGIGRADHTEIDTVNILQATLLAMQRAVTTLAVRPDRVLVDGNQAPVLECGVETIIKGDQLIPAIGAASILAKVARDEEMTAYDSRFPGYGFARHKGYPTAGHLQALARLGPCPIHRRSFAPVRKLLAVPTCSQGDKYLLD